MNLPLQSSLAIDRIIPLPGELHQNYQLVTQGGRAYLLKASVPNARQEAFHRDLLAHLQPASLPFAIPHLLEQYSADTATGPRTFRRYTWLPGRVLAERCPRTPTLLRNWGMVCGHLSRALQDFKHPLAPHDFGWDPLRVVCEALPLIGLTEKKKLLAEYLVDFIKQHDYTHLRRSINYNDAHELNLLIEPNTDQITGIIDFDDACYTATVCELAIACAYAGMGMADPLGAMREVVAGYHEVFPLAEEELAALYPLICARLLLTVTSAAQNRRREPDNAYLTVSEAPAWSLLEHLRTVAPALALAHFRTAAGLPAHPLWQKYHTWCARATPEPLFVFPERILPLDLSVGSPTLGANRNFEQLPTFVTHIRRHLEDQRVDMAVGGYGETRPVYTTDAFRGTGNRGPRWRSIHLGLDFWTPKAKVPVVCPLDGKVHSFGTDPTPGGYGTTIILRHDPVPGLTFYTLYGHLSSCSIENLRAGSLVQCGELLATIGAPDVNGGWPPHLHFQVMLDLLGGSVDFPGVAYPDERDVWLGLCPDPRTLIPHPLPEELRYADDAQSIEQRRGKLLGRSLSVSYRKPLVILRGAGQYLYDRAARRYLDTVNNVAHVGHEHPRVVETLQRQAALLNTNTRYLHPTIVALAERLTATLPAELGVVHFVNSGSEANELALRMAEAVTGTRRTLALSMGYHGNSSRTIEVSEYKFGRHGGQGQSALTHLLPLPDQLRGTGLDPLSHVPEQRSSFIHESILSCGGQLPLPAGYLTGVYERIRVGGGICIADEVQTGLGRVGSHFWAFQTQGVVPDIVTIGKPFGNGHPLGAVVCTPEVADAFANGMEYFNTFGGNPVSCAVGLAVLDVVRDEGLQHRAQEVGRYLTELLFALQADHPLVADVRGRGLFLGVELCGPDFAPATAPATYVVNRMRELGFLMSTDGPHENVFKIKPPMCFTRQNADLLVEYLDRVLREDGSRLAD